MTRAALLLLLLAGCSATPLPDPATPSPFEIVRDAEGRAVFEDCDGHQCVLIRQGAELLMMGHPSRIGDDPSVDLWDVRGATVDAFSEDE